MIAKLEALPEIHPSNLLQDLFGRVGASAISKNYFRRKPEIIFDREFWNFLEGRLAGSEREKKKQALEFVRRQLVGQACYVKALSPREVYLEGPVQRRDPIAMLSRRAGHQVFNLDTLDGYASLNSNCWAQQTRRESEWVDRITQREDSRQGVLIAGQNHVRGDYGLPERLEKKGIILRAVPGFMDFCDDIEKALSS